MQWKFFKIKKNSNYFYFLFYKIDIPCKNYHCNKIIDKIWNVAIKIYDLKTCDLWMYDNMMI